MSYDDRLMAYGVVYQITDLIRQFYNASFKANCDSYRERLAAAWDAQLPVLTALRNSF